MKKQFPYYSLSEELLSFINDLMAKVREEMIQNDVLSEEFLSFISREPATVHDVQLLDFLWRASRADLA